MYVCVIVFAFCTIVFIHGCNRRRSSIMPFCRSSAEACKTSLTKEFPLLQTFRWRPLVPVVQNTSKASAADAYVEYIFIGHGHAPYRCHSKASTFLHNHCVSHIRHLLPAVSFFLTYPVSRREAATVPALSFVGPIDVMPDKGLRMPVCPHVAADPKSAKLICSCPVSKEIRTRRLVPLPGKCDTRASPSKKKVSAEDALLGGENEDLPQDDSVQLSGEEDN